MTRSMLFPLSLTMALALSLAACDAGDKSSADTGGSADGSSDGGASYDGGSSDEGYYGDGSASDGGSSEDGGAEDGGAEGDTGEPEETECDEETPVSVWISPDDSNSMSSPVQIRGAALDGYGSLDSAPLRTWEMYNYYSFDYPSADAGELSVTAAAVPTGDAGSYRLQIGVSSARLSKADREPMNLALSIDTSGSMSGGPLTLTKEIGRTIASNLRAGDIISVVTWSSSNSVLLSGYTVTGPDDDTLLDIINGLSTGGSTNLNGGLVAAYSLVADHYEVERTNRVLLISDGGANAGVTETDLIAGYAGDEGEEGIYLVGVGVSDVGGYNDELMDEVTDAGRGASVFVYDSSEVAKVFDERFVNTMEIAARDVKLNLNMPASYEIVRFSAEELSTDPAQVDPQNIAPNDAMVFHQTIRSCAPEAVSDDDHFEIRVEYKDAVTWEPKVATLELSLGELLASDPALLHKGTAVMTYVDALRAWRGDADVLPWNEALPAALDAIELARTFNRHDADLDEIEAVLEAL